MVFCSNIGPSAIIFAQVLGYKHYLVNDDIYHYNIVSNIPCILLCKIKMQY